MVSVIFSLYDPLSRQLTLCCSLCGVMVTATVDTDVEVEIPFNHRVDCPLAASGDTVLMN